MARNLFLKIKNTHQVTGLTYGSQEFDWEKNKPDFRICSKFSACYLTENFLPKADTALHGLQLSQMEENLFTFPWDNRNSSCISCAIISDFMTSYHSNQMSIQHPHIYIYLNGNAPKNHKILNAPGREETIALNSEFHNIMET